MIENFERIAGSMINVILGALILWVGQTTYRHAGVLASLDQKFESVDQHFKTVEERYDGLRTWLDKVVNNIKDDSRLQFTTEDAAKLNDQLRKLDEYTYHVEQRIADRAQLGRDEGGGAGSPRSGLSTGRGTAIGSRAAPVCDGTAIVGCSGRAISGSERRGAERARVFAASEYAALNARL